MNQVNTRDVSFTTLKRARLAWLAALVAAAFPTWDTWKGRFDWPIELAMSSLTEEYYARGFTEGFVACVRSYDSIDRSPFRQWRDDLATLSELVTTYAVPLLIVLFALVRRESATTNARAAWTLTLIALVRPLSADYRGDRICDGSLPLFTPDWFAAVASGWGLYEVCLLAAALLVMLASGSSAPPILGRHVRRIR
ncbi:hypothetical protein AB0K18_38180 [Nonomuraea sp. NPDC049421]|uniref:hypothetical protein n=1 Tax=Nonomuraea sp. NPDC049421 TaxID=3155275 RepID=UPI00341EDDAC